MCIDTFDYKDGELYYKIVRNKAMKVGDKAGYLCKTSGYFRLKLMSKTLCVHRVTFAMHHGYCPPIIDHIDQNKLNNTIENLRACERNQNTVNSKVRSDNPYGYKGVTFHKATKKFAAQTMWNQKRIHIGLYNTPEEAADAYNQKMTELAPDFARLNEIRKKDNR